MIKKILYFFNRKRLKKPSLMSSVTPQEYMVYYNIKKIQNYITKLDRTNIIGKLVVTNQLS